MNNLHRLVLLAIIVTPLLGCGQSNSEPQELELDWRRIELPEDFQMSVSSSPDGTLYAVVTTNSSITIDAERDRFYASNDGGTTWQYSTLHELPVTYFGDPYNSISSLVYQVKPIDNENLLMIASIPRNRSPYLLHSGDSGLSWNVVSDNDHEIFHLMMYSDWEGNVTVSTYNYSTNYFMKSNDSGTNWQGNSVNFDNQPFTTPIINAYNDRLLGISPYGLHLTNDFGQTWVNAVENATHITKNNEGILAALFKNNNNDYIVHFSFDNGESWQEAKDKKINKILRLIGLSDGRFLIVTFSGLIYVTDDYGDSWIKLVDSELNTSSLLTNNDHLELFEVNNGKVYITNLHKDRRRTGSSINYLLVADLPTSMQ